MPIKLRIINRDQLPDGGPIEFTAGARGFDIGREQHLDWCLPDPERYVSGHHCQIRFQDGGYWLNDISTNGTFVNGLMVRVKSPYRLAHGDRLQIGNYQVEVSLDAGHGMPAGAETPPVPPMGGHPDPTPGPSPFGSGQPGMPAPPPVHDIWATPASASAPPPVERGWFVEKAREERGIRPPDALEQFIDLPPPRPSAPDELKPISAGLGNLPGSSISEQGAATAGSRSQSGMTAQDLIAQICEAAGLDPKIMTERDPREVARELGLVLRLSTEQLSMLLQGRANAKRITKSANRTMIGIADNNAMKFTTDAAEALDIMFRRSRAGYLDAPASFREAFGDIHDHEKATFAAMQRALSRLMEDLTPESVEDKVSGPFGAKAKAWDIYVQRWNAKTEHFENGILDVFFGYFSEIYDSMSEKKE